MHEIAFVLNGEKVVAKVDSKERLIDMLRDHFHLTGTKESCGLGECGTCTILLNDEAVLSCLLLAVQADGTEIITIEGLEKNGELDVVQQAFLEAGAVQCGYCTPGMVMAAKALLIKNPHPSAEEITKAMAGNLCRCTGYVKIHEAVSLAAQRGE